MFVNFLDVLLCSICVSNRNCFTSPLQSFFFQEISIHGNFLQGKLLFIHLMFLVPKQLFFSLLFVSAKKAQAKHEFKEFIPLWAVVVLCLYTTCTIFCTMKEIFLVFRVATAYT